MLSPPPKPLNQIQPNLVCKLLTCMGHATAKHSLSSPLGPWGGVNMSNIIKFQLQSQFQRVFIQTVCVFSQMIHCRYKKISDEIFMLSPGSCPRGGSLRYLGSKLNSACPNVIGISSSTIGSNSTKFDV